MHKTIPRKGTLNQFTKILQLVMSVSIPYSLFVYQRELKTSKMLMNANLSHAKLQLTQCLVQQNISKISYTDLKCCFLRSIDYKLKLEQQCNKQKDFKTKRLIEKQSKDSAKKTDLQKITNAIRKIKLNIYNF